MDEEEARAAVDNSAWDGNQAMVDAGAADDPAAAFKAICAGQRAGDTSQRQTWALPHHKAPADPPNAAGVRDAESRIGQAQGLINRNAAQAHLDAHMTAIQAPRSATPPRENLVRAQPGGFELRETADDGGMPTLTGHFAVFNEWTKIDSAYEGTFMERVAPGAFSKTFAEGAGKIRVLFQHGKDPHIGDKVLGMPGVLEEDAVGARYEVPLFDTTYNRDLLPGLRAGAYGSSFRFRVTREDMVRSPKATGRNPDALPERTIREAEVMEFGPVTFPAYAGATAGIRSMTDEYVFDTITADPARLRELVAYIEPAAPSADAGASPHLEPERRTTPVPVSTPTPKGKLNLDKFVTREEKASRLTDIKAEISRLAVEYPGVLPDPEQTKWNDLTAEEDNLKRDIDAWDSRQVVLQKYAEDDKKTERYTAPNFNLVRKIDDIYDLSTLRSYGEEKRDQMLHDNAMRAVETTVAPHPGANQDEMRAHVAGMLDYIDTPDKQLAKRILTTGSPGYRRAFNAYLSGAPMEQRYAALTTGTTTTGGFATPWALDPTVTAIGAWTSTNPFRQACRVVNLVGTNKWEALTASEVLSAYAGEAVAPAEGGPTFAQPTYNCLKATSFVTLSYEIIEDRPDIMSEVATLIQESKDTLEEACFSIGAGTTVPWGVALTAEYTGLHTTTAATLAIADIYKLEAALPTRHRANGAWFMSLGTIRAIQNMETVAGVLFGQPFATAGVMRNNATGNTGLQLLGHPVYEAPSITSTLVTPDTNPIVFMDPRSYIIVDRVGLNMERIDNIFEYAAGARPMGQRGLFAHWRNTARRINADAGRTCIIE